jgi:N-formylglutamate deformylase
MDIYHYDGGTTPLLISIPHAGQFIPETIKQGLNQEGRQLTDTDWHVDRLYAPFKDLGASIISANYSRYVVDLNRRADGKSLYPGQTVTPLCPTETFKGKAIYRAGEEPPDEEVERRVETYWQPYHKALQNEIERIKSRHGHVVLWDAHSIENELPRLFEGTLPDFNFGTNGGTACREGLAESLIDLVTDDGTYSAVLNGRFKGGAITRSYGNPQDGVSAIQLEMSQDCYMNQGTPFAYREDKAEKVQTVLKVLLQYVL